MRRPRLGATFLVALVREPQNRYDHNAVAARTMDGEPLGHLPRELATGYARALASSEAACRVCSGAHAWGRLIAGDWNIGIWLSVPDAGVLEQLSAETVLGLGSDPAVGETMATRTLD